MSLAALAAEVVGTEQALREVVAVRRRRDRLAVCRMAAAEPRFASLSPDELYARASALLGALDGLLLMRSLDERVASPAVLADALLSILDPEIGFSAKVDLPPVPESDTFPAATVHQEAALDALLSDAECMSGRLCDIDRGTESFSPVALRALAAFDTPEEFFAALMERRARLMLERKVTAAALADDVLDFAGALVSWPRYELHNMRGLAEISLAQCALAISDDHPNHEYFINRHAADLEACAHSFAELKRAGRTHEGLEINAAVTVFVALMNGLTLHDLLEPGDVDVDLVLARYLDTQVLG